MNTLYDKPLYALGCKAKFETAFAQASALISAMPGYVSHRLQRSLEQPSRYLLLIDWLTLPRIPSVFGNRPNTKLGALCYITFTTRFPAWNIMLRSIQTTLLDSWLIQFGQAV